MRKNTLRLTSFLGILAFVVLAVCFTPAPAHPGSLSLKQIATDSRTVYPYQASADRGWCVEMVLVKN